MNLKKISFLFLFLLLSLCLFSQVSKSITLAKAGELSNNLTSLEHSSVEHLKVSGYIDARDFYTINSMGKVSFLDLSDARIDSLEGLDFYPQHAVPARAFSGKELQIVHLPTTCRAIGNNAFAFCGKLESVNFGQLVSLKKIGESAFLNCGKLTLIAFQISTDSIESLAFAGCSKLSFVSFNPTVSYIGEYAFSDCVALEHALLPLTLKKVSEGTFSGCTALDRVFALGHEEILLSSFIEDIEANAFFNCKKLRLLMLPYTVKTIGSFAFYGCETLEEVDLPLGLTTIGQSAFEKCTGLTSITIPKKVTSIEADAFAACVGLRNFYCKNSIPLEIGSNVFNTVPYDLCNLYVPKGSTSAYRAADVWRNFNSILEEDASSINSISEDNVLLKPIANGIRVETKGMTPISIYTLSGQKVYQSLLNGNTEIYLDKGVYVLRVNNESRKFLVE